MIEGDDLFAQASAMQLDTPDLAGPLFLAAANRSPLLFEAYFQALRSARMLARNGRLAPTLPIKSSDDDRLVSVICCSVTPSKLETLQRNLSERLRNWELVHIADARSLSEGYTRGQQQAKGDLLIFCHDDIRVLAPDFSSRIRAYLAEFDVVGVAGATKMSGPAALWSGPPDSHGWIAYVDEQGQRTVAISSVRGPVVAGASVLDGVFIAGHRHIFESIGWDAVTFDGFHLYDIDFSWRASQSGASIGICQDLMIEHASRGGFNEIWSRYADRFARKFADHVLTPHFNGPNAVEIAVRDASEGVEILSWLRCWQLQTKY